MGLAVGGQFEIFKTGQHITYGAFITTVINFKIMAFVIFVMMKGINKLMSIGKKPDASEKPKRVCHILLGEVPDKLKNACIVVQIYLKILWQNNHKKLNYTFSSQS